MRCSLIKAKENTLAVSNSCNREFSGGRAIKSCLQEVGIQLVEYHFRLHPFTPPPRPFSTLNGSLTTPLKEKPVRHTVGCRI